MGEKWKTRMVVSVIIPVFNAGPFLFEALDSVVCQTYRNLEIIIVDDGSTDGSDKICDEYAKKDGRIKVIHQVNKGLSSARNIGLEMMTGDAVVFLDSDDAYYDTFIEKMSNEMVRNKSDLVICKYTINYTSEQMKCKDNTRRKKNKPLISAGSYVRDKALQALINGDINCSVWNKIYNKKLWDHIRFPDGHVYEDIDTMYRIIEQCAQISVLDESLYMYRKRKGSIIETCSKKNIGDCILACSHLELFVRENTPRIFSEDNLIHSLVTKLNAMILPRPLNFNTDTP